MSHCLFVALLITFNLYLPFPTVLNPKPLYQYLPPSAPICVPLFLFPSFSLSLHFFLYHLCIYLPFPLYLSRYPSICVFISSSTTSFCSSISSTFFVLISVPLCPFGPLYIPVSGSSPNYTSLHPSLPLSFPLTFCPPIYPTIHLTILIYISLFHSLGSIPILNSRCSRTIIHQIAYSNAVFSQFNSVWSSSKYSLELNLNLFNINVISILTYGYKSWSLSRAINERLLGAENNCLRRIFAICCAGTPESGFLIEQPQITKQVRLIREQY